MQHCCSAGAVVFGVQVGPARGGSCVGWKDKEEQAEVSYRDVGGCGKPPANSPAQHKKLLSAFQKSGILSAFAAPKELGRLPGFASAPVPPPCIREADRAPCAQPRPLAALSPTFPAGPRSPRAARRVSAGSWTAEEHTEPLGAAPRVGGAVRSVAAVRPCPAERTRWDRAALQAASCCSSHFLLLYFARCLRAQTHKHTDTRTHTHTQSFSSC